MAGAVHHEFAENSPKIRPRFEVQSAQVCAGRASHLARGPEFGESLPKFEVSGPIHGPTDTQRESFGQQSRAGLSCPRNGRIDNRNSIFCF